MLCATLCRLKLPWWIWQRAKITGSRRCPELITMLRFRAALCGFLEQWLVAACCIMKHMHMYKWDQSRLSIPHLA